MNYKMESGDYEVLYPITLSGNISDLESYLSSRYYSKNEIDSNFASQDWVYQNFTGNSESLNGWSYCSNITLNNVQGLGPSSGIYNPIAFFDTSSMSGLVNYIRIKGVVNSITLSGSNQGNSMLSIFSDYTNNSADYRIELIGITNSMGGTGTVTDINIDVIIPCVSELFYYYPQESNRQYVYKAQCLGVNSFLYGGNYSSAMAYRRLYLYYSYAQGRLTCNLNLYAK